jgi:hypothetical protein
MNKEQDDLARLVRLFEDYTIRRCWPEEVEQAPRLSVDPTLLFDLGDEKARAIHISRGSDEDIHTEQRPFTHVKVAASTQSTEEEVDYCFYQRGEHWLLCRRDVLDTLRDNGHECVEDMWSVTADLFPELLGALVRTPMKGLGDDQLKFLLPPERADKTRRALKVLSEESEDPGLRKLRHAEVLPRPDDDGLRGFVFLDDIESMPEEGERMLLLYHEKGSADLFQWSQGEFRRWSLGADHEVDLTSITRCVICSNQLNKSPEGVRLFPRRELDIQAVADYVVWHPELRKWERRRKRRYVGQLQQQVEQLEAENRALRDDLQRAEKVLKRLRAEKSLKHSKAHP